VPDEGSRRGNWHIPGGRDRVEGSERRDDARADPAAPLSGTCGPRADGKVYELAYFGGFSHTQLRPSCSSLPRQEKNRQGRMSLG